MHVSRIAASDIISSCVPCYSFHILSDVTGNKKMAIVYVFSGGYSLNSEQIVPSLTGVRWKWRSPFVFSSNWKTQMGQSELPKDAQFLYQSTAVK